MEKQGFLTDVDGNWSSKRLLTLSAFVLFVGVCIGAMFGHTVSDAIVNANVTVMMTGLAATASERFGKKFDAKSDSPTS